MPGLIGRKIGMTQIFAENGTAIPVTVVAAGPCPVVQVKTIERDGYAAVQLAYDVVPARKLTRPQLGHLQKREVEPHRVLREFRTEETGGEIAAGAVLDVTIFAPGDRIDVVGRTKGRGFQGVVRRHGFHGGPETHGCKTHDQPGSIGASASPARVVKGKKLPGQMGAGRKTIRNLRVVNVDKERNLLVIRGAVPGCRNSLVLVRKIAGETQEG
ncbi:MAG: 50S ribosomal protein L3 [Candidatus Eisenbacteria sp.]|nr:50S ribosomal protein L3 [Candidatus Eisenbacteria bacterium]